MKHLNGRSALLLAALLLWPQIAPAQKTSKSSVAEQDKDLFGIVVSICQYTNDSGEALPPLNNLEETKKILWPYQHNNLLFINSQNGKAYQPNAAVSGMKLVALKGKQVVLFYEADPAPDGKRWVLFLPKLDAKGWFDLTGSHASYVRRVSKKEWKKLRVRSKN